MNVNPKLNLVLAMQVYARVVEAGTGSGALAIALCRATGAGGLVVSYELRPEHLERAAGNIEAFFGKIPEWLSLRSGDLRDLPAEERFGRAVLDLPQPWDMLATLRRALEPGGVVAAYLPTTIQVQQLVTELASAGFHHVDTFETLHRSWHVTERSVRPDHRMVGHTGFVTVARRTS